MRKKYKHLFFDLDDTLWDLEKNSFVALCEIFDKYELTRFANFDQFYALYTTNNKHLWELYTKEAITRKQLNHERFLTPLSQVGCHDEELISGINDDYMEICPTKPNLKPHAIELLDYLKPNYNMHIISNGFSKTQQIKMQSSGIIHYFDNMYFSEIIGCHKPGKRIFEHAVKSSNARKTESIMVGDNFEADIVGAKDFGIHQIYVNPDKIPTLPFVPTYVVQSLLEIKNIL
jgi:putative hydrolase of the HAD superfamily